MANNIHLYGFRPICGIGGGDLPPPIPKSVASGQDDQDASANSINLNVGDPVKLVNTGGVTIAGNGGNMYGVIVGIGPYYDATNGVMTIGKYYPNQTTWGTVEERRGWVYVIPGNQALFEVDVDDATTATTKGAYEALVGENADHTIPGDTGTTSADPYLDISVHAVSEDLTWRIVGVSRTANNKDFSGSYVKLIVTLNENQFAGVPATNQVGV